MSGLATIMPRDGRPADPADVRTMLAAVPYLGPDGSGLYARDELVLGFAKLATTPEEVREQQPLVSPRSGCVLIADARLDNREELLAQLPDHPAYNVSDADLILRAYEAWDLTAPARLLGDFAFILWDPRVRRLVAARDSYGQRTLFYRYDQRTFAAASEIHQLLQDPEQPVLPNEDRLHDYLVPFRMASNEQDQAATFYAGIYSLPAAHYLVVDRERLRLQRYWEFRAPHELRYRRTEEYAEHFQALFFDVVRARLRTAGPVGALLSGGLDSSSIVCTAQELYRRRHVADRGFTSFSLVFAGLECDERPFIQDIQTKYGFAARYIPAEDRVATLQLRPHGFMRSPDKGTSELDAVYDTAVQAGVRVLLSGEIADSCAFGSRFVFDSLLRHGHLRELRRQLRTFIRLSSERRRKIVGMYCLLPLLPIGLQQHVLQALTRRKFARARGTFLPEWMPEALQADLEQRHLELTLAAERGRRFANPSREREYRLLYPPEVGRPASGRPLQVWRPFADRRLHEFLLAIPPEQKFEPHPASDEWYAGSKLVVRRAMRGILPEAVRTRTVKTHFASLFEHEFQRRWPDFEGAFGPSGDSELAARGYIEPGLFWERLQKLREGDRGGDFMYLLRLMGVETWLRTLRQPRVQLVRVPDRSVGDPFTPSTSIERERQPVAG